MPQMFPMGWCVVFISVVLLGALTAGLLSYICLMVSVEVRSGAVKNGFLLEW